MLGIKNITYKYNSNLLIIKINDQSTLTYNNIESSLPNNVILKYIESLYKITNNWQHNYINHTMIDGISWNLSITFEDNTTIEYSGKGDFPNNFESFERLNQSLIKEVL